jgi:hypothetical protein
VLKIPTSGQTVVFKKIALENNSLGKITVIFSGTGKKYPEVCKKNRQKFCRLQVNSEKGVCSA